MTDKRDNLNQLRTASLMDEGLELSAMLKEPAYMDKVRQAVEAVREPAYVKRMRQTIEAFQEPAYMEHLRQTLEAFREPAYMEQMRHAVEAVREPAYMEQMRRAVEAVREPAYMEQIRHAVEAAREPAYMEQIRHAVEAAQEPAYMAQIQQAVAAAGVQNKLFAGLNSYKDLLNKSALASFLVSADSAESSLSQVVEVAGFDNLEMSDHTYLDVELLDSLDQEIMIAISNDKIETLSPTAIQRLQAVCIQIILLWDMLLRIVNTIIAYTFLVTLLSGSSVPSDISAKAASLSNEQRELLADYRIVNRQGARLRAEPTTESKAIASLKLAQLVEVTEYNDKGWYRVTAETSDGDLEGWMYVSVTTPIPKPKRQGSTNMGSETD